MIHRPWPRAAAAILSGGLLGLLVPAAANAEPSHVPPPEPAPAAAPGPQSAFPELPMPEMPVPSFPTPQQTAVSETPGSALPEAQGWATMGQPALAMLGVAGQGLRIPLPSL